VLQLLQSEQELRPRGRRANATHKAQYESLGSKMLVLNDCRDATESQCRHWLLPGQSCETGCKLREVVRKSSGNSEILAAAYSPHSN